MFQFLSSIGVPVFADPNEDENDDNTTVVTNRESQIPAKMTSQQKVAVVVPENPAPRVIDRYGFYVTNEKVIQRIQSETEEETQDRQMLEAKRAKKWLKMLTSWSFVLRWRPNQLKRRLRKGIPDMVRGKIWVELLKPASEGWKEKWPLSKRVAGIRKLSSTLILEIEKDIDRTYPNHAYFEEKEGEGQLSLRNLLQWYGMVDPEIGYCQAMGFIAAMFLTYMSEEDAFYSLVAVLQRPSAPLRNMYLPDMRDTLKYVQLLGELVQLYLPEISKHFEKEGVIMSMFSTEWIMTVFTRSFNFDVVTRVWDIFLREDFKIVLRTCLALLKYVEQDIMATDFDSILELLKELPSIVEAEPLMAIVWEIPLKRAKLQELSDTYDIRTYLENKK